MLISLDDVQWADPATLAALGSMTRQLAAHRILWLLAVRSGELAATGARRAAPGCETVRHARDHRWARWTRRAVAGVAADLLGGVPDPPC